MTEDQRAFIVHLLKTNLKSCEVSISNCEKEKSNLEYELKMINAKIDTFTERKVYIESLLMELTKGE